MGQRGSCDFVKKVRNAEDAGAGLAIIIDNEREDVHRIEMIDDGAGAGLRIPSMLISEEDGRRLTDFLATASQDQIENVMMLAEFDLTQTEDDVVHYDLWYSSVNDQALDFI